MILLRVCNPPIGLMGKLTLGSDLDTVGSLGRLVSSIWVLAGTLESPTGLTELFSLVAGGWVVLLSGGSPAAGGSIVPAAALFASANSIARARLHSLQVPSRPSALDLSA